MQEPSTLINLVKWGGPVFGLAALIVLLGFKVIQSLLAHIQQQQKQMSNHLSHLEGELVKQTAETSHMRMTLEKLVHRIDQLLLILNR